MNPESVDLFIAAFSSVSEALIICFYARSFSVKQSQRTVAAIVLCLVSVIIFASLRLSTEPLVWILFTLFTVLLALLAFGIKRIKALLLAFLFCILMALCDTITASLLMLLTGHAIDNVRFLSELNILGNIISKFLLFFFVILVSVQNKVTNRKISKRNFVLFIGFQTASVFILYALAMSMNSFDFFSVIINIIGIGGLLLGNLFFLTIFDKEQALELQLQREVFLSEQMQSQKRYYESSHENQEEIKKMRHDLKSILTIISGYLKAGRIDEAVQFIEDQNDCVSKDITDTGHPALDALLSEKIELAQKRGITTKYQVIMSPLSFRKEIDVCIILGNALDNAIEASEKSCEKRISLMIEGVDDSLLIRIENSLASDISADNFSFQTNKPDRINHGVGFPSIKTIVEKYDGVIQYSIKDSTFRLTIMIASFLKD